MNHLFFGVRGQGKTTLAFYTAKQTGRSIAVYDVSHRFNRWPELIFRDAGDFEDIVEAGAFDLVIYQPQDDAYEEFGEFSEILWDKQLTLLLDEASELQEAQSKHHWLHKWIRMHDIDNSDVLQTLHAPADSWSRCRSLANFWYIFQTWRPADLHAIADHCGDQVALEVTKLREHEYVFFDVAKRNMEICKNPALWYVPITARDRELVRVV